MGNSLSNYRQAIGLFNRCKSCTTGACIGICWCLALTLIFLLIVLLLLCGDVESNPGPIQRLKNLAVCHVNIRGLTSSKIRAIKASLCNVYDIITISETFLGPLSTAGLELPGYHDILRRDRPTFGGGLAIYIKQTIPFKRIIDFESMLIENIWIEVNTSEGKLLICNVYRPPNCADFWEHFDANIDLVKSESMTKNLIILGDLNADFNTLHGRHMTELCLIHNLHYHINEPTRITATTKTCLDQIISNIPNFISSTTIDPPVSTNDHCTVGLQLKFNLIKEQAYHRHVWLYEKRDNDGFRQALSNANWELCFLNNNVDEACSKWTETFINIARVFIPNKSILIRPRDSPWFTCELRKMRRKIIRLYHNAKTKMNAYHWNKYKVFRNEYQCNLDKAEGDYTQALNDSLKQNRNNKGW